MEESMTAAKEKSREADPQHIYDYMQFRTKEEGQTHVLPLRAYQFMLNGGRLGAGKRYGGTLYVFGVQLAEDGTILYDDRQPEILARYWRRNSRALVKALKAAMATWNAWRAAVAANNQAYQAWWDAGQPEGGYNKSQWDIANALEAKIGPAIERAIDLLERLYNSRKLSPMAMARAEAIFLLGSAWDDEHMWGDAVYEFQEAYVWGFERLLAELESPVRIRRTRENCRAPMPDRGEEGHGLSAA